MRLFDLAQFVTLAEADLRRVLDVQKSWSWDTRGKYIAEKMLSLNCGIWLVEEYDEVDDLREQLNPKLKLAAFKHRKVYGDIHFFEFTSQMLVFLVPLNCTSTQTYISTSSHK